MKLFTALTVAVSLIAALAVTSVQAAPLADLSGGQTGRIEFQSISSPNPWAYVRKNLTDTKTVTVWGDLLMPKNINGKVPALVIMHGSAGVEPWAYELWAARLNPAGAAVFVVDSYKPRGVESTSSNQLDNKVTVDAQTADSLNALRLLATHPQIDASRIYVIGMSRGGNPAFYSAWPMYQAPVETSGAKFAGHMLVYPGMCNIRYRADAGAKATAPIFFALPDRDKEELQDVAVCERYAKELAAAGSVVTSKEYKGTYHAWDGGGRRFRYENAHSSKPCDMELEMTNVAGGGLGRNAKDLKTGKQFTGYEDWLSGVKGCMATTRAGIGGNAAQSDELVKDVLKFMGVN